MNESQEFDASEPREGSKNTGLLRKWKMRVTVSNVRVLRGCLIPPVQKDVSG